MNSFKFRTNIRTNPDFHSTTAQKIESQSNTGLPSLLSDEEIDDLLLQRNQSQIQLDNMGKTASAASDGLPESTIEQRFAHVAKRLVAMWPSEACALYISKLVVPDRVGRQGFPQEVMDDLMMLYQMNDMLCRDIGVNPERSPCKVRLC